MKTTPAATRARVKTGAIGPHRSGWFVRLHWRQQSPNGEALLHGHALIENRHGLVVQADTTAATGKAEQAAALAMIDRHDPGSERRLTLAADKGYDTSDFVADLRQKCVTPHMASKIKGSAIDGRTTRHEGYKVSKRKRKLIEEALGRGKTIAGIVKVEVRGLPRVRFKFTFAMATYNLVPRWVRFAKPPLPPLGS